LAQQTISVGHSCPETFLWIQQPEKLTETKKHTAM